MELHKACDHFIIPHSIESHRSDAYYLLATGISHDDHIPFAKSQQVPQGAVIVQSFTGWMHSSVSLAAAFAAGARCGKFCTQKANKPEAVH